MGSPKEFTNEQHPTPTRNNAANASDHRVQNREPQGAPSPPFPSVENRAPHHNRENETPFQTQRSLKSSRERMHVPYENESRFSPTHSQYRPEPQYPEMVSMHEQNPRVFDQYVMMVTIQYTVNNLTTIHQKHLYLFRCKLNIVVLIKDTFRLLIILILIIHISIHEHTF
jgi:hypothetical protein